MVKKKNEKNVKRIIFGTGTSYTLTYADNKNAGTASVTINGKNSLHGQIVEYFTIQKANQNAPTGLTPTAETIDGKNDGQITNLATTMEYSVDQTSWTACTGTTLTQLSAGDYYVRYKETNNYYASPSTKVVVAKGATPSPTGEQTTTEKQTTGEQAPHSRHPWNSRMEQQHRQVPRRQQRQTRKRIKQFPPEMHIR